MADKFTKVVIPADPPVADEPAADAWKDTQVEKEHQPAKQKSVKTYRNMENEVANMDKNIKSMQDRKKAMEDEMKLVKAAVEA